MAWTKDNRVEPMMIRARYTRKDKDGKEQSVEVEVDTRDNKEEKSSSSSSDDKSSNSEKNK